MFADRRKMSVNPFMKMKSDPLEDVARSYSVEILVDLSSSDDESWIIYINLKETSLEPLEEP
jgi:hypothetical protein